MKESSLLQEINKCIFHYVEKYKNKNYKSCWISSGTDLIDDLKMSKLQIIELLLELEDKYHININASPMISPSFKISYFSRLIEYAMRRDLEYGNCLLEYALTNVNCYKKYLKMNSHTIDDILWNGQFHRENDEFRCINDKYYELYYYGNMIYRRSIDLNGKFTFSLKSSVEETISDLQIWKKRTEWYGITTKEKRINFAVFNYVGNRLAPPTDDAVLDNKGLELIIYESAFTPQTAGCYLKKIVDFAPRWITGSCSAIYNLSMGILRNREYLDNVSYIEILADNVISNDIMDIITEAFKCAKISVIVQNSHVGQVLMSCPNGHLHQIGNSLLLKTNHKEEEQYSNLLITDLINVIAPVINVDSFLLGKFNDYTECVLSVDKEPIVELLPTNYFDGFIDKNNNWAISAKLIRMCIELANEEYNNPFLGMQIVQRSSTCIYIFLELSKKFKEWEKTISNTVMANLKKWVLNDIEWNIAIVDELYPCEYTGVLSYYQNYSV